MGVNNTIFLNVEVGSDEYVKKRFGLTEYPTLKVIPKGSRVAVQRFTDKRN